MKQGYPATETAIEDERRVCLFKRAQQGDRSAFDALIKPLEKPLHRFTCRLIGHQDTVPGADDLVAEAFHALYRNLSRLETAEGIKPFLYRVVRNRAYDILRRQGRFTSVSLDDADVSPLALAGMPDAPVSSHPDKALEQLLLLSELQQAIDRLPEPLRELLLLYTEEEFTYAEIATTLKISIALVKSRLFQARRHLRRLLRPETLQALGIGDDKSS